MLADAQEIAYAKDYDTVAGGLKDLIALDIDTLFNVERGDAVNMSDVQESLVKPGGDAEANIAVGPPPPDPYGVLSVFEDNEKRKVSLPTDLGLYWEPTPPPPAQNVISRDDVEVRVTLPTDLDCYWNF
ncbi:hypothetical protein EXIGLDRAFT_42209 [Exidia glandulosa HHB12029]|uniref:Uncharacterized protein n=1 Tax=Exidia glandulosa HHB12029 TaxID=1314781 RepID=A0A165ILG3_EXIGL|nr:hypothetical protein EXIGLDRAFT_42209 [Exidia glandulosa HHB12029]